MKLSTSRVLTSHVGSLPRPVDLLAQLQAKDTGEDHDREELAQRVAASVTANLPPEVVATLNRHLADIFNDHAFLDRLAKVGVWPRYRPSSALDLDLREDIDYFGGIIRRYKIGAQ